MRKLLPLAFMVITCALVLCARIGLADTLALRPTDARLAEQDTAAKLQDSQNVELVGQIGGASYAVAVSGNLAYVGVGPRLVIINIADPAHPVAIGQTSVFPDTVQGVAVAGSLLTSPLGMAVCASSTSPTRPAHRDRVLRHAGVG